MPVTIDSIRAAAATLAGAVQRTPTLHSRLLSELSGATVFLKMENLQYTASFKERGALVRLSALSAAERTRGVITMSAGNHALGLAYHARRLGIPATIVMPRATPFVKVANTRYFAGRVVLHGESLSEAARHAHALAAAEGLVFVHPYDDPAVIAGQGTVGLELIEDVPDLDAMVLSVGGGGLIAGCATAAKAMRPAIRIYGVQNTLYPAMVQALRGGPAGSGGATIAEGIAVTEPGALPMTIIARLVDDLVLVSEADIEDAVAQLIEIEKTVVEGAGAAGLAALFRHRSRFAGQRVGLVLCGGNIDSRLLASVLMRGLVRRGRLSWLRVPVSDQPGALAQVASLIAGMEANVVEISHQRLFHDIPVKMADLDLILETRDGAHVQALIEALAAAGFHPQLLSGQVATD